ncbi:hypothetical protein [Rossellomorea marisflavi]|nr:hypothetical protein [Rossellomorea marisflavi]
MIKKLIHEIGADRCGGFYTEEVTSVDDRIGFRCVIDGWRKCRNGKRRKS